MLTYTQILLYTLYSCCRLGNALFINTHTHTHAHARTRTHARTVGWLLGAQGLGFHGFHDWISRGSELLDHIQCVGTRYRGKAQGQRDEDCVRVNMHACRHTHTRAHTHVHTHFHTRAAYPLNVPLGRMVRVRSPVPTEELGHWLLHTPSHGVGVLL